MEFWELVGAVSLGVVIGKFVYDATIGFLNGLFRK